MPGRRDSVARHQTPGLLHVLGVHAHDRADRAPRLGDRGVTQLARPAALADPLAGWTGRPVGGADLGVALQPDDVAQVQLGEEAEQLGVGEAAVGQDGGIRTPAGSRCMRRRESRPQERRRSAAAGGVKGCQW